ncbi:MAG: serine hydrolase [Cyclobacteriaceae bacterium]
MKFHQIIIASSILFLHLLPTVIEAQPQSRKLKKIQKYIDNATQNNLTGVSVYVKSPKLGEWTGVSGYSNVENETLLEPQDIFGLASIGKMYIATAVLKLVEDGKFDLDDKISSFLPSEIIENAPNATEVTIRHLLGHTSGFVNYETDPELNRLYLEGELKLDTLTHMEALQRYFYGKESRNAPGEKYRYSSTNYLLLSMIMDKVLDQGHEEYMRSLLAEHGLDRTWYKQTPPDLINHYGDLNKDGVSENLTCQTIETTNWFSGDDGIYTSIDEAASFLEKLMKGEILNQSTLKEMQTWDNEKDPDYGLGLEIDKAFPYKLTMGHSGSAIGMRTDLYYFPKQDMIVGIFSNSGLRAASPTFAKTYYKMRTRIMLKLFLL